MLAHAVTYGYMLVHTVSCSDLRFHTVPCSSVHHEFLSFIKPAYYIRPRSYSLSLSRPPFLIAYQGVLFRKVRAVPQSGAQLRLRSGGGW